MKEETFGTNFTKLKKESLELKQKAESLLVENKNLLEKLKQEADFFTNRRWNQASQALNWLSKNHNHGKNGLDFVKNTQCILVIGNMLDYQKILCVIIVEKSGMLDILVHLENMLSRKTIVV